MDPHEQLEQLIAGAVQTCNDKRAKEGKEPLTDEEIDEIRQEVLSAVNSQDMRNLAANMQQGGLDDMRKMAFLNGMAGGAALFRAIIMNCPGLDDAQRERLCGEVKYPDGLRPNPQGRFGGMRLVFAGGDNPKEFMLHVAAVDAGHDMGAELAKIQGLAGESSMERIRESSMERIREQMGHLMQFARQAYAAILMENQAILGELKEAMKALPAFDPTAIHVDDANTTLYLAESSDEGAKKWEPRCGLCITAM